MRTAPRSVSISGLLFGKTRGGVLGLLYARPDESFYVREIARYLRASAGTVQRELKNLSNAGLIRQTGRGNLKFYRANEKGNVFAEMRALLRKTAGVVHLLRSALEPLSRKITVAFIYGSVARNEEKAESDVDVMIVGSVSLDDVFEQVSTVEREIGHSLDPTVYSDEELKSKLLSGNRYLSSVVYGKKVFLVGGEEELEKLGKQPADQADEGRMTETGAKHHSGRRAGRKTRKKGDS